MFRKSSAQGYSFVLLIVYFDKQEFTEGRSESRDSAISAARGEGCTSKGLSQHFEWPPLDAVRTEI